MNKNNINNQTEKLQPSKEMLMAVIDKYESNDPRSIRYIRKLNRPTIKWREIIFVTLLISTSFVIIISIAKRYLNGIFVVLLTVVMIFILVIIMGKKLIITLIQIYQRYAPISIRNRCMFEPSCSEYAIQALQKYGLIKGIVLAINRLKRCNPSGGGFDYLK